MARTKPARASRNHILSGLGNCAGEEDGLTSCVAAMKRFVVLGAFLKKKRLFSFSGLRRARGGTELQEAITPAAQASVIGLLYDHLKHSYSTCVTYPHPLFFT